MNNQVTGRREAFLLKVVDKGEGIHMAVAPSRAQVRRLCEAKGYLPTGPYFTCPVHVQEDDGKRTQDVRRTLVGVKCCRMTDPIGRFENCRGWINARLEGGAYKFKIDTSVRRPQRSPRQGRRNRGEDIRGKIARLLRGIDVQPESKIDMRDLKCKYRRCECGLKIRNGNEINHRKGCHHNTTSTPPKKSNQEIGRTKTDRAA